MRQWKTPRHHRDPAAKATTASGYRTLQMTLPVAYLRVLDEEARLAGFERPQFLRMLLQRRLGTLVLARSAPPVTYKATREELVERERWVWYLSPADGQQLDDLCLRLGGVPATMWMVREVHDWLGAGDLWDEVKPGKYELRSGGAARA